jgi:transcriptional regulator with XRE-family HTH domain
LVALHRSVTCGDTTFWNCYSPQICRILAQEVTESNAYTRTLELALETVGDLEALAKRLGVSAAQLKPWLRGECAPPPAVFLAALDIVARGPLGKSTDHG